MRSRIIVKELLLSLRGLRFAIACGLCLVLSVASITVLLLDYRQKMEGYASARIAHLEEARSRGTYFQLGGLGMRVDRSVPPLQVLAHGVEEALPRTAWVSDLFDYRFEGDLIQNPLPAMFPFLDVIYIVSVVMGLLAMVFSYDSVCGEKEDGTLRQILSNSVSRNVLLFGKWAGGSIGVLIPFLGSMFLGLTILQLSSIVHFGPQEWAGVVLLIFLSCLYISAMYNLGLLISTRTTQTSTSIVALLLVWVLLALVIPNLSQPLGDLFVPAPSVQAVENQKNQVFREETAAFHRKEAEMRRKEGEWRDRGKAMYELRVVLSDKRAAIESAFRRRLDYQTAVVQNISRLSPLSCYVYAGTTLAATGLGEQARLARSVRTYQRQFSAYIERMSKGEQNWGAAGLDLTDLPAFDFRSEPLASRIHSALFDALLLIMFNLVFFAGAYVSFLRYDVR